MTHIFSSETLKVDQPEEAERQLTKLAKHQTGAAAAAAADGGADIRAVAALGGVCEMSFPSNALMSARKRAFRRPSNYLCSD